MTDGRGKGTFVLINGSMYIYSFDNRGTDFYWYNVQTDEFAASKIFPHYSLADLENGLFYLALRNEGASLMGNTLFLSKPNMTISKPQSIYIGKGRFALLGEHSQCKDASELIVWDHYDELAFGYDFSISYQDPLMKYSKISILGVFGFLLDKEVRLVFTGTSAVHKSILCFCELKDHRLYELDTFCFNKVIEPLFFTKTAAVLRVDTTSLLIYDFERKTLYEPLLVGSQIHNTFFSCWTALNHRVRFSHFLIPDCLSVIVKPRTSKQLRNFFLFYYDRENNQLYLSDSSSTSIYNTQLLLLFDRADCDLIEPFDLLPYKPLVKPPALKFEYKGPRFVFVTHSCEGVESSSFMADCLMKEGKLIQLGGVSCTE